ncbi:uncharacterized protein LOC131180593 [Hevea brasiliensis]|uniref:uncharacterized protein LOC131180593 n=1 Tax=Hevea brasiliensis TaxID=3981 RepID=UPI0025E42F89|nr:uncharacterized protein LOC131180593 [Hevea brasiliensis]
MAANAYRTQVGTTDQAIAELLIAGLSGQLKGWWDYYLTPQQRLEILKSVELDEDQNPILDENGRPIQNAVATLILAFTLHFVGDPSHLKDKNAELLSNLRCKKLSDFKWYKDTFLTGVMLREDSNLPFWKEKFLAGLPPLLGEKVRNKIKEQNNEKIPYDQLTYGELISFTQKEDCQTRRHRKHKKHFSKHKTTYYQDRPPKGKSYKKPSQKPYDPNSTSRKDVTCYRCGKKGHIAKYCKINKRIHELQLEEETLYKLEAFLLESFDSEETVSISSEDNQALQLDEVLSDSSTSDKSEKQLNMLTRDQRFMLDVIQHIQDPQLQKEYLTKLQHSFEASSSQTPFTSVPSKASNPYDLTAILQKAKTSKTKASASTIQEL